MTISEAFETFDVGLNLTKGERKRAQNAHNELRDVLADANVAAGAILQGSFARKTMLAPLKDIDMVVFLHAEHVHLKTEAGGSDEAMDLIGDALGSAYPDTVFDRSAHALKVDRGDDFTFDIVPGFDTDTDMIWIADRDQDRFELSDTRRVTQSVQERNQACGEVFIHQVRMIKHWMCQVFGDSIPGFVGECITYAAIVEELPHDKACAAVFSIGAELVAQGSVAVPRSDENVLERLTGTQVTDLHAKLEDARNRAAEALELAEAGDEDTAVDVWHSIFSGPFPEAPEQPVKEALAGLMGGGVSSTLRVTEAARHHRAPVTRSWGT